MARNSASQHQSITFIGGTFDADYVPLTAGEHSSCLACATVGNHLEIQAIKLGRSTLKQLRRVGLQLGQTVTVLSCAASGSVIVACAKGNVGLGAAIARRVIVTPAAASPAQQRQGFSMKSSAILPTS